MVQKDKTEEWKALHGRRVEIFFFTNQRPTECPYVQSGPDGELILHCENMGDRMETWVCHLNKSGREIARHNAKAIESIVWAE